MSQDWGRIVEADVIRIAKPCLRCGYSLRGTGDAIRCPECGLRTWLSLTSSDGLRLSNPKWVGRMSILLMTWGIASCAFAALGVLLPAPLTAAGLRDVGLTLCLATSALWLVGSAALNAGVAACRERRRPEPQRPISWFLLGTGVVSLALVGVALLIARGGYALGPWTRMWVVLFLVPFVSSCWAMFLISLMSRSESPLTVRWVRRINLAQLLLFLTGPLTASYASLALGNGVGWMIVGGEVLGVANGAALIAVGVLSVKSSIVLLQEQALARQEWNA
jgi:hypothetical protein